jgi:hypothetical protein
MEKQRQLRLLKSWQSDELGMPRAFRLAYPSTLLHTRRTASLVGNSEVCQSRSRVPALSGFFFLALVIEECQLTLYLDFRSSQTTSGSVVLLILTVASVPDRAQPWARTFSWLIATAMRSLARVFVGRPEAHSLFSLPGKGGPGDGMGKRPIPRFFTPRRTRRGSLEKSL